MKTGTVKWYNSTKGYGFITPDDNSGDVFVHVTEVQQAGLPGLAEGQRVSFNLQRGRNGKDAAVNIRVL